MFSPSPFRPPPGHKIQFTENSPIETMVLFKFFSAAMIALANSCVYAGQSLRVSEKSHLPFLPLHAQRSDLCFIHLHRCQQFYFDSCCPQTRKLETKCGAIDFCVLEDKDGNTIPLVSMDTVDVEPGEYTVKCATIGGMCLLELVDIAT
jgi:hypothetical protein